MFRIKEEYGNKTYIVYAVSKGNTDTPKFLIYKDGEFVWEWASIYKPI